MGQADVFGLGDGLPRLRRGLRVTHLGDERLVLDPASGVVHTVRGAAVSAVDAILAGRPARDEEVLAALAGAGIVEVRGVARRDALLLAGSAAALIASVSLPSALAAASTFNLPAGSGGDSATTTEFTLASGHRLYRLFDAAQNDDDTSFSLSVTFPTTIEVLLVGGGGPGGEIGDAESAEFFGGGGGGGEVAVVNLGRVTAGSVLQFTVAGRADSEFATAGRNTVLTIGSDSVTALGGGRGAGRDGAVAFAAGSGGSGGGGSPSVTGAGGSSSGTSTLSGGRTRTSTLKSAGGEGDGGDKAAAGGGGALSVGSPTPSSNTGGDGGDGVTLSGATGWDLTVLSGVDPTTVQNIFGSGGGGAGIFPGSSNSGSGRLGGFLDGLSAKAGIGGPLASGGGGGGGIRVFVDGSYSPGGAGDGGPGVVWVRTIS